MLQPGIDASGFTAILSTVGLVMLIFRIVGVVVVPAVDATGSPALAVTIPRCG